MHPKIGAIRLVEFFRGHAGPVGGGVAAIGADEGQCGQQLRRQGKSGADFRQLRWRTIAFGNFGAGVAQRAVEQGEGCAKLMSGPVGHALGMLVGLRAGDIGALGQDHGDQDPDQYDDGERDQADDPALSRSRRQKPVRQACRAAAHALEKGHA